MTDDLSPFKAQRAAALAKLARDDADNDPETLIRVTRPQDVYDALNLLHTRCMDHLDPNTIEEHPITRMIGEFLDKLSEACGEIRP